MPGERPPARRPKGPELTGHDEPLTGTLCRVAARDRWLQIHSAVPDRESGWRCTKDLLRGAELREVVDELAAALAVEHPGAAPKVRRTVAAAVVAADWTWALAALAAGALACDARVPRLSSSAVWLRWVEGRVAGVAVTSYGFWCTAADPQRDHASASVTDRLEAQLRSEIAAQVAELDAALQHGPAPLLRRGPRAVWGGAGDGIAVALRLQADGCEDVSALLDVADRVLAGAPRSWRAAVPVRATGSAGEPAFSRRRASCCLYYRLPTAEPCLGCPRRPVPTADASPRPTQIETAEQVCEPTPAVACFPSTPRPDVSARPSQTR